MLRSLAVVGIIVVVMVVLNYRGPHDAVNEIDPAPLAVQVAGVAPFPVLLPADEGWRATAARWEPTQESAPAEVWFTGGVYSAQGPFASVSQSTAGSDAFIAEQTGDADPAGTSAVAGQQWQRFEGPSGRSLVLIAANGSVVVTGTGSWADVERFTASLAVVPAGA